jgi:hypothetical protein
MNSLAIPPGMYVVASYLGEFTFALEVYAEFTLSCLLGFILAIAYNEYVVERIIRFYWLVTVPIGVLLMISLYVVGVDKLPYVYESQLLTSFYLMAYFYKEQFFT